MFRVIGARRKAQMKLTDKRVKLQNETLAGIRVVKLNAWEAPMLRLIGAVRAEELGIARGLAYLNALVSALIMSMPVLVAVAAFTLYAGVMHKPMGARFFGVFVFIFPFPFKLSHPHSHPLRSPQHHRAASYVIFPSLTLFNQLRFPIMFFPRVLSMLADAIVSLSRLHRFLALPEADAVTPAGRGGGRANAAAAGKGGGGHGASQQPPKLPPPLPPGAVVAELPGGDFYFSKPAPPAAAPASPPAKPGAAPPASPAAPPAAPPAAAGPFLRGVKLSLRKGTLTVVVGPVGSGKSALAAALLGELWPSHPSAAPVVRGRVAYVAQTAWVQSLTVQENILFGQPMDRVRYEQAIDASCLGPDLALLPNSDATEIGERGITLSGGQKQRVAIARALYADADLVVMDDPLSALDAHVGRAVFEKCVRGAMRHAAVLLITHALPCAADADDVVVMSGGRCVEQGAFATLLASGGVLSRLMAEHGPSEETAAADKAAGAVVRSSARSANESAYHLAV